MMGEEPDEGAESKQMPDFRETFARLATDDSFRRMTERVTEIVAALNEPLARQAQTAAEQIGAHMAATRAHQETMDAIRNLEATSVARIVKDYSAFNQQLALKVVPDFSRMVKLPDYSASFADVARMEQITEHVGKLLRTAIPPEAVGSLVPSTVFEPVMQPLRDAAREAAEELNAQPVRDLVDTLSEAEDIVHQRETMPQRRESSMEGAILAVGILHALIAFLAYKDEVVRSAAELASLEDLLSRVWDYTSSVLYLIAERLSAS